jgi:hypothetical protein
LILEHPQLRQHAAASTRTVVVNAAVTGWKEEDVVLAA